MNRSLGPAVSAPETEAVASPRVPGEAGIWLFVTGDLLIFSLLFGTFLYYRGQQRAEFIESQSHLTELIGMVNTFLLLTSSWFVATAVEGVRSQRSRRAGQLLLGAIACGVLFLVDKGFEWRMLIAAGHTLQSDDFFMLYYMLTGIHAVHVVLGIGVLIFLWTRAPEPGDTPVGTVMEMESGAIFWHLVDLLWIVLFALFYLMR